MQMALAMCLLPTCWVCCAVVMCSTMHSTWVFCLQTAVWECVYPLWRCWLHISTWHQPMVHPLPHLLTHSLTQSQVLIPAGGLPGCGPQRAAHGCDRRGQKCDQCGCAG